MSREIKFRIRDKKTGKIIPPKEYYGNLSFINGQIDGDGWDIDVSYILEQYTGIKDKNGVEIYEGDIISMWYAPRATCKGNIVYKNGSFWFITEEANPKEDVLGNLILHGNYLEVVGNIHEGVNNEKL